MEAALSSALCLARPSGAGGFNACSLPKKDSVMPGTYTPLLLHVVFSTKRRQPWITQDVRERLYKYLGGIVRGEKGVLYEVGGVEDHVHLNLRWRPDAALSDLMRDVKA